MTEQKQWKAGLEYQTSADFSYFFVVLRYLGYEEIKLLRSTWETLACRGFFYGFFPLAYRLRSHLISRFRWTGWHFASISCGRTVTIVIKGIPSYHTLVERAWSSEISSWNAFDKLSEFATISSKYLQFLWLIPVMKTSESCVAVCFLGIWCYNSIQCSPLIFD